MILEDNQYPSEFYLPIIHETLTKIRDNKPIEKPCFREDVTGKRLFYIQYRGPETSKYIESLIKCGAPIMPILTTRKLKTCLPSLKPSIENTLKSNVIYKITCPRCSSSYAGLTTRHVITRVKEHFEKNGIMRKHIDICGVKIDPHDCFEILDQTNRGLVHFSIFEALYIRDIKPVLNTKDEYIEDC